MLELKKADVYIRMKKEEDVENLLNEVEASDVWVVTSLGDISLEYIKPYTTAMSYTYELADDNQKEDFYETGGIVLNINENDSVKKRFICAWDSIFTIKERSGLVSRYLKQLLKSEEFDKACELMNMSWKNYSPKSLCQILIRSGHVLAVHSKAYSQIFQKSVYKCFKDYLNSTFNSVEFKCATYTHEQTRIEYALNCQEKFFTAYKNAWLKAGNSEEALAKCKPILSLEMGDTGKQAISIRPVLSFYNKDLLLGEKLKIKHIGKASLKDVEELLPMAFSKLVEGTNTLGEMLSLKITHPIEVMKKAAEKSGLYDCARSACKTVIEDLKNTLMPGETSTAYDIYLALTDLEFTLEFAGYSNETKLKVLESMSRLFLIDWAKLDSAL